MEQCRSLLLPFEETDFCSNPTAQSPLRFCTPAARFFEQYEPKLTFMTMCVTTTARHEMPIVAAYTGDLPSNIMCYHRLNTFASRTIAPHFYTADTHLHNYLQQIFQVESKLRHFHCSIAIDFSMTSEMTTTQKQYASFLNKLWAAWLQSRGHSVIPNVSFPDEVEKDYWLEGWPTHSVVAVSSVGVIRHGNPAIWLRGMERIRQELQPIHILRYGSKIEGENTDHCTYFLNDNKRAAYGW